jgi:hypothetical protein
MTNQAIMDIQMKKVLLYIGIGLLLLGIPATIFFLGQQRDIRTRAAPATTLTLTPAVQTVKVGDTIKLNVDIDPGANQVISADIYVTYDPAKLEAQTITNGTSAPRVLNSGIIESGTASIKVGAASNAQPIVTRGTIAVITFTAKEATNDVTPTAIQFASNTFAGGLDEPTASVLVGTTPAKITITDTSSTGANFTSGATPTATPTATLTPAAGATPTATPTATLTPAAGATPTLSASESAESSASATALQILAPEENADVTTSQPLISGKAPPGTTVTIVIHSDAGTTVTVTADANGNWVYTPTTPLDPGPHSVVASAQDAAGTTQTTTATFVVAGAGEAGATESAVPISGNIQTTLLIVGLGILLISSGVLVWHF